MTAHSFNIRQGKGSSMIQALLAKNLSESPFVSYILPSTINVQRTAHFAAGGRRESKVLDHNLAAILVLHNSNLLEMMHKIIHRHKSRTHHSKCSTKEATTQICTNSPLRWRSRITFYTITGWGFTLLSTTLAISIEVRRRSSSNYVCFTSSAANVIYFSSIPIRDLLV